MAEHRRPDPQPVPAGILRRDVVQPPERVLASRLLQTLAAAPDDQDPTELATSLRRMAAARLGPAYTGR